MDTFTTEVYPRLVKYLWKVLRDGEAVGIAIAIAWWLWQRNPDAYIGTIGRTACRYYWRGRDIPGVASNLHRRDAMRGAKRGWDMARQPGRQLRPDQQAILNEEVVNLFAKATSPTERGVLELILQGHTAVDIAKALGVNESTVHDAKRRLRARD